MNEIAFYIAGFIIVMLGIFLWEQHSCASKAELMKVEWVYNITTGCMIQSERNWVPLNNYRQLH